ncbi:MAG: efflux RND transporter periplasmic adaptor subunit [Pseudomonadota bacterium]
MSVFKQLMVICALGAIGYGVYTYVTEQQATERTEDAPRQQRPVLVETARAETRLTADTVEAVGTTRARQSIEIEPETDGRVAALFITPGARVDQGAVLVQLDDTVARANLVEAEARLTEQQQVLTRIEQLRSTNAVALATLQEATARLAEANAQLERARQGLSDRTITAPFAGVVGLAEVDIGAQIEKGDVITRLDDLSEVELEFSLPETLYGQVRRGLKVDARSAAFPDRVFSGEIDAVDSRIDPVARAFRTRAVLPNPDGTLPAGMFMSLTLTISEQERLSIPEEAVIFQAAETYVFRIEGETASRVPVRTGARHDGQIVILSGLEPEDDVAIRGHQRLTDGARIRIRDDPASENAAQSEAGSDTAEDT